MSDQVQLVPLKSLPGCKRDGTLLEGKNYVDNQWCRYQRGLPRKIGGYRRLANLITGVGRGMNVFDVSGETYTHIGTGTTLQQMKIDPSGVVSGIIDRTPVGFTTSAMNLWQFDSLTNTGATTVALLAHAAPNAADISSNTAAPVYYGDIVGAAALTATAFPAVSGGTVVSGPYAWAYGSSGLVYWSPPNDPNGYGSAGSGAARICSAKIVRGMALRSGAGNGPTTLFWTLNSLERATFVGGTPIFNFDTISPSSSILSADSVIEYNGIYFWCGVDSFLLYNGVVRELPNDMNINWFFDNLNYAYRSRVYAVKFPRWGEIWWCYPRGSATECTHAIIYNVRENTWYDTELPNSGRSCGQYAQVFKSPLMCGVDVDTTTLDYKLWQHDAPGVVDEVDGTRINAVPSFFETNEIGFPVGFNGIDAGSSKTGLICNRVEPDFVQSGQMYLIVKGRANCRAPESVSDPYTFEATAPSPKEETLTIRQSSRYMRFQFGSNVQGGDYQMGDIIGHTQPGEGRVTS